MRFEYGFLVALTASIEYGSCIMLFMLRVDLQLMNENA